MQNLWFLVSVSGETSSVTGRRTKLPAPRPNLEGLSLWNILCKNIGKDLSQVSMPVSLNEPLNMLQVSAFNLNDITFFFRIILYLKRSKKKQSLEGYRTHC